MTEEKGAKEEKAEKPEKKEEKPKPEKPKTQREKGVVFVGSQKADKKGPADADYENAIYTQFSKNDNKVSVRARGRACGRVINICAKMANKNNQVKILQDKTEIGTETIKDTEKGEIFVTTLSVNLSLQK